MTTRKPRFAYGYGAGFRMLTEAQMRQRRDVNMLDPEFLRRLFAMFYAAHAAGIILGIGGGGRTAAEQRQLFLSRHDVVTDGSKRRGDRLWNGKRYRLKPGVSGAASPGSSYHEVTTPAGKALAVDLITTPPAQDRAAGISRGGTPDRWMAEHEADYGLDRGIASEKWHMQPKEVPTARRYYRASKHKLKKWALKALPGGNGTPDAPAVKFPPFDPGRRLWSLWPLNTSKPTVTTGDTGEAVRYLQGVLRCVAYVNSGRVPSPGPIDGRIGPMTAYSVRRFQQSQALEADSIVGPLTWAAIDRTAALFALPA